jgi:hypothetical protein
MMTSDEWLIAVVWFVSQWVMFGIGYLHGRYMR